VTGIELCRTAGLAERELRNWIDYGLLDAHVVARDGGGHQRPFSQDQAERACLRRALHRKGVALAPTWPTSPARPSSFFDGNQTARLSGRCGGRRRRGRCQAPVPRNRCGWHSNESLPNSLPITAHFAHDCPISAQFDAPRINKLHGSTWQNQRIRYLDTVEVSGVRVHSVSKQTGLSTKNAIRGEALF
jgi:hypothetical protein